LNSLLFISDAISIFIFAASRLIALYFAFSCRHMSPLPPPLSHDAIIADIFAFSSPLIDY